MRQLIYLIGGPMKRREIVQSIHGTSLVLHVVYRVVTCTLRFDFQSSALSVGSIVDPHSVSNVTLAFTAVSVFCSIFSVCPSICFPSQIIMTTLPFFAACNCH